MPYTIRKIGNKYCVQKEEGSRLETVPGGCHDSKEEAIKHMQAIVINENK